MRIRGPRGRRASLSRARRRSCRPAAHSVPEQAASVADGRRCTKAQVTQRVSCGLPPTCAAIVTPIQLRGSCRARPYAERARVGLSCADMSSPNVKRSRKLDHLSPGAACDRVRPRSRPQRHGRQLRRRHERRRYERRRGRRGHGRQQRRHGRQQRGPGRRQQRCLAGSSALATARDNAGDAGSSAGTGGSSAGPGRQQRGRGAGSSAGTGGKAPSLARSRRRRASIARTGCWR